MLMNASPSAAGSYPRRSRPRGARRSAGCPGGPWRCQV